MRGIMRTKVAYTSFGEGVGPRLALLPGLGARGEGFAALAQLLALRNRPIIVEYPEGHHAAEGPRALARRVAQAVGPVDGVVASSYGGLVAAHMVDQGAAKGIAFIGSFSRLSHLGWRGALIAAMGPIAWLRPGLGAATLAAAGPVERTEVPRIVPTTARERSAVWHRSRAAADDPPVDLRARGGPCVAIQGRLDVLVPMATLSRLVADLPEGTAAHVLPMAGHVPYHSHPWEVARLLAPWVSELSGRKNSTQVL